MFPDPTLALRTFTDGLALVLRQILVKPVRDMTQTEAFNLFLSLVADGKIELIDPIRTDRTGKVLFPTPGGQVKIRTSLAGVSFRQAIGKNKGAFGSIGAQATPYFEPTPTFAIVLYRFAAWLSETWNATTIVWGGIGHGSGKQETDCHTSGHCVDFYGATTSAGVFDVRRDWYRRPVYLDNNYLRPKQFDDDFWGTSTHTNYRLMRTKDAEERPASDPTYWNPRARDFFLDVV
ncbi:MAG: hypothetical protein ABI823_21295, partial [Bryobacteraceae bacterium]